MSSFIKGIKQTALAVLLVAGPALTPAAEDVVITSEQSGTDVIALGQTEFTCVRGNPKTVAYNPGEVIGSDLDFSGRFRVKKAPVFTPVAKTLFMQDGALARIEELTRIPADVQDALITILSEKTLPIAELGDEAQALKGFNVIATANDRDKGVNELSSALRRRFNTVVMPLPASEAD